MTQQGVCSVTASWNPASDPGDGTISSIQVSDSSGQVISTFSPTQSGNITFTPQLIFSESFESNVLPSGWITYSPPSSTSQWMVIQATSPLSFCSSSIFSPRYASNCSPTDLNPACNGAVWMQFTSSSCYYSPGDSGNLTSPSISLPSTSDSIILSFCYILATSDSVVSSNNQSLPPDTTAISDFGKIFINGQLLDSLPASSLFSNFTTPWRQAAYDISQYAGSSIVITFLFDSTGAAQITSTGFQVDNIVINTQRTINVQAITQFGPGLSSTATLSNPSSIEICNNLIDDDCNGLTDEGCGM